MKIAVCISGQQRKCLVSFDELQSRREKAFSNVDAEYFYHTWDTSIIKNYENIVIEPEPEINYSPIKDTTSYAGEYMEHKRNIYSGKCKLDYSTKQILAHNSLVMRLPKQYDVVVRCRWDLYFSDTLDYRKYLEEAFNKGPVGLGYPKWDMTMLNNPTRYEKTTSNKRWHKMISPDNLIMHKLNIWDTTLVEHLHRSKKLLPAEWGWYQILCNCKEDSHSGYRGGAITMSPGNNSLKIYR